MILKLFTIVAMLEATAFAAGTPIPLPNLERDADVIVLATLQSAARANSGGVKAELQPVAILKGQVSGSPVTVELAPSRLMTAPDGVPFEEGLGATGLWFLKEGENNSLKILPIGADTYTWESDAFLSVPTGWSPPASGTLTQQLLTALIVHYRSLPVRNLTENFRLIGSLKRAGQSDALAVSEELMASPVVDERVVGLASAIYVGSDEALSRLAKETEVLRFSKNFNLVVDAIYPNYQPHGISSIAPLGELVALRSDIPGFDFALVRVLGRMGNGVPDTPAGGQGPAVPAGPGLATKQMLPIVVDLLDSRDPQAQLMAARLISQFAELANADGEIIQGTTSPHPFRPDDILRFTPSTNSDIPVAVYVSYWKSWWAQNRAKLGFPASGGTAAE